MYKHCTLVTLSLPLTWISINTSLTDFFPLDNEVGRHYTVTLYVHLLHTVAKKAAMRWYFVKNVARNHKKRLEISFKQLKSTPKV